jgi:hypothetical protein
VPFPNPLIAEDKVTPPSSGSLKGRSEVIDRYAACWLTDRRLYAKLPDLAV